MSDKAKMWAEILRISQEESDPKREDEKDFMEMMAFFGLRESATKNKIKLLMGKGLLTRRRWKNGAWLYSPTNSSP